MVVRAEIASIRTFRSSGISKTDFMIPACPTIHLFILAPQLTETLCHADRRKVAVMTPAPIRMLPLKRSAQRRIEGRRIARRMASAANT